MGRLGSKPGLGPWLRKMVSVVVQGKEGTTIVALRHRISGQKDILSPALPPPYTRHHSIAVAPPYPHRSTSNPGLNYGGATVGERRGNGGPAGARSSCARGIQRAAKGSWVARPPEPFPRQASPSSKTCFHARLAKTGPAQFLATPKSYAYGSGGVSLRPAV